MIQISRISVCYIRKEKVVLMGKGGQHEPKPQQQLQPSRNNNNNDTPKSERGGKLGTIVWGLISLYSSKS